MAEIRAQQVAIYDLISRAAAEFGEQLRTCECCDIAHSPPTMERSKKCLETPWADCYFAWCLDNNGCADEVTRTTGSDPSGCSRGTPGPRKDPDVTT